MEAQKIIAAGGLVYNSDGDLLWMYRRGKWDLPKGKVDEGESIEECAVREVKEETGLRNIQLGRLIGTTQHNYTMNNIPYEKTTHWFVMHVNGEQKLQPQAEEDILELKWVAPIDMPQYLADTYENIKEIIRMEKNT